MGNKLDVGNVVVEANTISTTDTGGDLNLTPANGGKVIMTNAKMNTLSVDNIRIDSNEITSDTDLVITPGVGSKLVTYEVHSTKLEAGNLKLEGNTITAENTNGDITLLPHGTGKVVLQNEA